MEMIFDEHVIIGPRVKIWYPLIKESFKGRSEYEMDRLHDILPQEPMFKDDQEYLPLQAADLIAWLFRMAWSGNRNEFEWIAVELSSVIPMSEYSSVFTAERMQRIKAISLQMNFPPDLINSWQKRLGIRFPTERRRKKIARQPLASDATD